MRMTMRLITGNVAFTCRLGDAQLGGYLFAGTQLTSAYGSSLWTVQYPRASSAGAARTPLSASWT
jgi:hypothetical protein